MKKAGSGFRALLLFVGLSFLLVQGGIGEAFGYEGLSRASGARCSEPNNAVSAYFRVIDTASPELKQAIRQFPKGADLHNHLSGSIMPETYIEMGKKDGNCYGTDPVDPTMRTIIAHTGTPDSCPQGSLPLSRITADDFQRLVASLSMYRYPYTDIQSGHDQFFATFGRFGVESGSRDNRGIMLAHLLRKASEDNLSYVETMMSFQSAAISNLADKLRQKYPDDSCYTGTGRYLEMLDFLMQSGLADAVTAAREDIAFYRDKARTTLQCGTPDQDKACLVSYAMVAEVNRNSGIKGSSGAPDLPKIFTQTAFSFLLSLREKNVVAVDLVSGEDLPVSMQSFRTVMQFFSFFHSHQTYKDVNISLHAGEITPCFVGKGNPALKEHLIGSLNAGAKRIGHAVSIAYLAPDDQKEVIALMKEKNSLYAAPFTSNAQILGVAGKDHPFQYYWESNVPTAFATDDAGVSYATYTDEWVYAFRQYDIGYDSMVRLARYSLQYSFAPGAPLWQDVASERIVDQCRRVVPGIPDPPDPCKSFLTGSGKAKLQWDYEESLSRYMSQFGRYLKTYEKSPEVPIEITITK